MTLAKIVVLLSLAVLAACSDSRQGETTLRFWAMGREGEVVKQLIPQFERENPGIRVTVQQVPWSAAHEKLLTSFAGDSLPDMAQLGNTWLPEFQAIGALDPVPAGVTDPADHFPGIWSTNVVDGTAWGVPWYVDTRLLFYRTDILKSAGYDTPPQDWAGWMNSMRAVKAQVGPSRYAILAPLNEYEPLLALSLNADEALLKDDGTRGNFSNPGFIRTLAFYRNLYAEGLAPLSTSNQIANVWSEFGRAFFSFYITGPWNISEFKRRLPAGIQDKWMTAPLPGPDGPGASIAGGSSLVVFRSAENKDAAWKLVAFLSRPDVQVRFHGLTGNLPPRRSAWGADSLTSDVYARAFRDQLERAKPAPKVPEWERIATELRLVTERLVVGNMTVQEVAAELDRRANRILEKRRWMLARKGAE